MGSGLSCFKAADRSTDHRDPSGPDHGFAASDQLDETLGHSFCYVRSSARFLSPTASDRFVSPTHSLRFEDPVSRTRPGSETGFKAISGASVIANTATPRTVLPLDAIIDYPPETSIGGGGVATLNGFESTSSFSALPLQPAPRGGGGAAAGDSGSGFFLSGPIERRFLSGPLDPNSGPDAAGRVPFSAPLGGNYPKKRRKKSMSGIRNAIYRNFSEKKRQWVVPVLNFKKEAVTEDDEPTASAAAVAGDGDDVQWALGKAGEDRVQVVVSEEQGWLFVGIYDGFNGPDAPEFLMDHLYRAVHNELRGLFWEAEEEGSDITQNATTLAETKVAVPTEENPEQAKRAVTFQSEVMEIRQHRRRLWEFLADPEDGLLDLSGSQRFAFSVDEAIAAGSSESKRWLLLSRLKQGLSGQPRKLFPWRFGLKEKESEAEVERAPLEEERSAKTGMKRKEGPADHELVLGAMSRALESVENAYLDITDKVLDMNPELALMGSCLLVVLMRDEDVYVMNLGDSRAIVARFDGEDDVVVGESSSNSEVPTPPPPPSMRLSPLQLSTDHSTSIEEEVIRIKNEHPDDNQCIVNGRVKGRLKVTRAFGAGFLKQPKLNDAVLEMFRNDYIGNTPYISSCPSLCHHELCPRDQFLVLSSDGLYQYFSNEEVVAHIESFMEKYPDGDPAQHLIEELLSRAAKKAGMDLNELLDIPQGDRRKYHDDVTVMVISLEGRIWKSSGKYF